MRVKSRTLGIIFVAAVIVPSILLAVLSIRAAGREEAFVEKQLATTLLAEVTQTAGLANAEVGKIVDELRTGIDVPADGDYVRVLRQWQRASPLVAVPFLLSPRFGILWPRTGAGGSALEKLFLQDNGGFLSDRSATTVLQNIAVRYREEILAETRKAEEKAKKPIALAQEAPSDAKAAPAKGLPARSAARDDTARSSDIASRQQALDAFAQSPAIQSRVYTEAREQGDTVSPRVVQPLSKMSQNAAPTPPSAGSPVGSAAGTAADEVAAGPGTATGATAQVESEELSKKDISRKDVSSVDKAATAPVAVPATVPATVPVAGEQQSQFVVTSRLLSQIAAQGSYGLIPRFTGEKLSFLFWERQKDGRIAGCQIDAAAFRGRIAGLLSGTYTPVRIITILDEIGAPLAAPPESGARNWRLPFVSREIGESLPRWEAAGYLTRPDAISSRARSSSLVVGILVLILFVSMAGGGTMVLSSVFGEMRLAQKKATFVTNVSHELKTPLTSISLFVELLRRKRQPDPGKRDQYLSLIASETERLTRLINNVLDFSSMERGGKRYAMKTIDAALVAGEIVESQRMRLETRGFILSRVSAGGPTLVRADPEALKQIILNLLSNAEKYSPQRKEIEVEVAGGDAGSRQAATGSRQAAAGERANTWVLIHVRDRGIGIAAEDRERIFREFFRVDDSLASRVQGSGLGLTIARRIARDHGGDLSCAPREGGGSDFIVSLPAADNGSEEDRS